jgi:hypothetical protein
MESAGRIFDVIFGTPAETVLTVAAVHGLLPDAEAASVVQGVQNQHENKGGLSFPAQRANARVADFAPLAGISLPVSNPGRERRRSKQVRELPESAHRLDQALVLQRGEQFLGGLRRVSQALSQPFDRAANWTRSSVEQRH